MSTLLLIQIQINHYLLPSTFCLLPAACSLVVPSQQNDGGNELTFNNPGVKNTFNHGQSERERQKMKNILRDIAIKEGRTPPPDSEEDRMDEEGDVGRALPEAAAQIYAQMDEQRLKDRKAGIDKQNRLGETAILRATQNGDEEMVRQLIADGADVNIADYAGWTPLHESATVSLAKLLLDARANPNHTGPKDGHDAGNTPLHEAARHGNAMVIKVMLMRNANSRLQNSASQAAADLADDPAMAKLLREHKPEEVPLYIPAPQEKQNPEIAAPPLTKSGKPVATIRNSPTPDGGGGGTSISSSKRKISSSKPAGRPSRFLNGRSRNIGGVGGAHNSGGGSRRIVLRSAEHPDAEEMFFTTATAACDFLKSGKSQFYGAMRSKKAYKGWYVVDEGKKDGSVIPVRVAPTKPKSGEMELEVDVELDDCDDMAENMEAGGDNDERQEGYGNHDEDEDNYATAVDGDNQEEEEEVDDEDNSDAGADGGGEGNDVEDEVLANTSTVVERLRKRPPSPDARREMNVLFKQPALPKSPPKQLKAGELGSKRRRPGLSHSGSRGSSGSSSSSAVGASASDGVRGVGSGGSSEAENDTAPPTINLHPTDVVVYSGPRSQVVFFCDAKSRSACTYQWEQAGRRLKDGKLSDGRDSVRGATKQTLIISNCRSDGSKKRTVRLLGTEAIRCMVTNSAGSVETKPAKFRVKQSPREAAAVLRRDYDVAGKLGKKIGLPPPPKCVLPHLSQSKPSQKDMDHVDSARDILDNWTRDNLEAIDKITTGTGTESRDGSDGGGSGAASTLHADDAAQSDGVAPLERWDALNYNSELGENSCLTTSWTPPHDPGLERWDGQDDQERMQYPPADVGNKRRASRSAGKRIVI